MVYPKLVRKENCKTDIHVILYGEGTTEDGEPIIALETRSIYQGTKARNPDGTVNFTELEIM